MYKDRKLQKEKNKKTKQQQKHLAPDITHSTNTVQFSSILYVQRSDTHITYTR